MQNFRLRNCALMQLKNAQLLQLKLAKSKIDFLRTEWYRKVLQ